MAQERKRIVKKEIPKTEPKQRVGVKLEKDKINKTESVKVKKTKDDDKFIKISELSKSDEFRLIGERVQKGELKWNYYANDSGIGYHYYLIINKTLP